MKEYNGMQFTDEQWKAHNMDFNSGFNDRFFEYLFEKFCNGEIPFVYFRHTHPASRCPISWKYITMRTVQTHIRYSDDEKGVYDEIIAYLINEYKKNRHLGGIFLHLFRVSILNEDETALPQSNNVGCVRIASTMVSYGEKTKYKINRKKK